ncbi:MAG: acyl-CoA/acyl-ACP dehydrogenase [Nitrospirae bacterium]|nr:acyl-CoA/acyl-ACP dehydrogenase [Nitrospirota bacterium]
MVEPDIATPSIDTDGGFDFDDHFFGLVVLEKHDPRMVAKVRESWLKTRRFCREHLVPHVLSEDRKNMADPQYISWDLVRLAARHGQLSRFIPPFFGGGGEGAPAAMGPYAEEQSAVDTGFSGMLGGHGLGLVGLALTFNMRVLQRVAEKVVAGEKSETPYLIDAAITEPTAGTDVEEVELYPKARLISHAKKVPGGAILNGRKVFISTGHMASDHLVFMPFDLKDPVHDYGCFIVPKHAKGFSLGRKERKMGHLVSTVSELIFEDCFVPEEDIVLQTADGSGGSDPDRFAVLLETVLGITRTAVGAMGVGNARGSFERVLALAKRTLHKGRTLVNQQWAQTLLTNMHINVVTARSVYLESTFALMANLEGGLAGPLPPVLETALARRVFANRWFKKVFHSEKLRARMLDQLLETKPEGRARIQFMSSLSKVVGSDAAMENGHMAVEFLSRAGVRHDRGVEKGFRDAKLLQIFEGTNQLNRLNIFKHYLGRRLPGVKVF